MESGPELAGPEVVMGCYVETCGHACVSEIEGLCFLRLGGGGGGFSVF